MKKQISVLAEEELYGLISSAAKAQRISRGAWMLIAAEEKLSLRRREPIQPVGSEGEKGEVA